MCEDFQCLKISFFYTIDEKRIIHLNGYLTVSCHISWSMKTDGLKLNLTLNKSDSQSSILTQIL